MRTSKNQYYHIIAIVFLLFVISCTPESCYEQTEAFMNASFYSTENEEPLAPDSLTIYGLNKDSLIYNAETKVLLAHIPLNPATDTCIFIIRINGVQDTLEFIYSSFPHLISKECGYSFFHTLEVTPASTNNAITNITMVNDNITILNEANIKIYY